MCECNVFLPGQVFRLTHWGRAKDFLDMPARYMNKEYIHVDCIDDKGNEWFHVIHRKDAESTKKYIENHLPEVRVTIVDPHVKKPKRTTQSPEGYER